MMIAKKLSTIMFGLLMYFGVGVANATLLTNGTFDINVTDGWTIVATTGVTHDDPTDTAHVGRPGPTGFAVFSQTFDIPIGTSALLIKFDYEWQSSMPTIEDFFKVEVDYESTSGGGMTIVTELLNEGSSIGMFGTTVLFSTVLPLMNLAAVSPNGEIRFRLDEAAGGGGTRVQLDNVYVQPVPEPATLILLGIGLAGMGIRFRRRRIR